MEPEKFDISTRAIGPIVGALEEHGCDLRLVTGPTWSGTLTLQLIFPDDEYIEKKCRSILEDWRAHASSKQDGQTRNAPSSLVWRSAGNAAEN